MRWNVNIRKLDEEITVRIAGYRLYIRLIGSDDDVKHITAEINKLS